MKNYHMEIEKSGLDIICIIVKVNEENAWKQINEMIRILYKDYLEKNKDYLGNLTVLTILYIAYLENILIQIFGFVNIVT